MGLVSKLALILSFTRATLNGANVSDVKTDPGGGANVTAQHFSAPGDDSVPLVTDYALTVPGMHEGQASAVGYLDPKSAPVAVEGEKRIYSRDAAGETVAEVHLKNEGTIIAFNENITLQLDPDGSGKIFNEDITIQLNADGSGKLFNASGFIELLASGVVDINGATIDTSGKITSPVEVVAPTGTFSTSLTIAGKELNGHLHSGVTAGPSPTGPNI